MAQFLAEKLIEATQVGKFVDAFTAAGKRLETTSEVAEACQVAAGKYRDDPNRTVLKNRAEELEAAYVATHLMIVLVDPCCSARLFLASSTWQA